MSAPPISLALARRIINGRAPDQVIHRNGDPLFERWWLLRTPSDQGLQTGNIYLHRWLRSDMEDPHCHPWWNETTVLCGRLVEDVFLLSHGEARHPQRRVLDVGMSAMREPQAVHRIVDVEPGTITLFVTARKTRDWGFYPDGSFIPWQDYHGRPATAEVAA